jgi:hypothetical protein
MFECLLVCSALALTTLPESGDREAMAKEYNVLLGRMRVCDNNAITSSDIVMRIDKVVMGRASFEQLDVLEPMVKSSEQEGEALQKKSPPDMTCDAVKKDFGALREALAGIDPSPEVVD